ncbi:uncharacterized protein LOC142349603 [Convolutriloba macropyga]|uniref:uncharacterized protein LOC142349603 n=1 Tax=Convolutriloba macropyga TaxID=536237 RepID=UPI003F520396
MSFTHKLVVFISFPRLSSCKVIILFTIVILIVNQRPKCTLQHPTEKRTPSNHIADNYSRAPTTPDPKIGTVPNCEDLKKTVMKTGYSVSGCRGRLGNQLGVMALGMQIYLRFGTRLLVNHLQYKKLNNVFDMEQICKSDASTFCIGLPKVLSEFRKRMKIQEKFVSAAIAIVNKTRE